MRSKGQPETSAMFDYYLYENEEDSPLIFTFPPFWIGTKLPAEPWDGETEVTDEVVARVRKKPKTILVSIVDNEENQVYLIPGWPIYMDREFGDLETAINPECYMKDGSFCQCRRALAIAKHCGRVPEGRFPCQGERFKIVSITAPMSEFPSLILYTEVLNIKELKASIRKLTVFR